MGLADEPAGTGLTRLLARAREGDPDAVDQVFEAVYHDLRSIAHRQLAGPRGDSTPTLNTTALVHEAYLKLARGAQISPADRNHLLAIASRAMRQISIDYARRSRAEKRGGDAKRRSIDETGTILDVAGIRLEERADEIVALDKALTRLGRLDARLSQVVELRFFGGLDTEDVAAVLGASPRTVKRLWRTARAFLFAELRGTP